MTLIDVPSFLSVEWDHVEGRGDRAVVTCQSEWLDGLAFLIGGTAEIDGRLYDVWAIDHPRLSGPMQKGERIVLWVWPHYAIEGSPVGS